jgi:AraC family transcriptional regulator
MPEKTSANNGTAPAGIDAPSAELHDAPGEISKIIDTPVALNGETLRGDTRLTRRWSHGEIHDQLPGMSSHVLMTYYGAAKELNWRSGNARQSARTRPGTITVIPDGHGGRWDIGGPIEVSHVYLTDKRLQNSAELLAGGQRIELLDRVGYEDPMMSQILAMLSQSSASDPASRLFVEQAVDLLCTHLIRGHSSIGTLPQTAPRQGLADWQVKRVTGYMEEFIDREIGLEELAALTGLSRFHFSTAFRLATGASPHQYLTALRMTRARRLLVGSALSVIQVALAVGYQTPSAFTATFRKANKLTPSEFRRGL